VERSEKPLMVSCRPNGKPFMAKWQTFLAKHRQTHLLGGMIGRIHAPTETSHRLGERRLRVCRTHTYALAAHGGCWARAVATFDVLADVGPHGDIHQSLNARFG